MDEICGVHTAGFLQKAMSTEFQTNGPFVVSLISCESLSYDSSLSSTKIIKIHLKFIN